MRIVRGCLVAALLSSSLLVVPGCTSENVDKGAAPADTSHAAKSSDDLGKGDALKQRN